MKAKTFFIRLVLILPPVLLLLLLPGPLAGNAAVRVQRPISLYGGQINQSYLWAEETQFGGNTVTHRGVDFSYPAVYGTDIYAVADGFVRGKKESLPDNEHSSLWGNYVLIEHFNRHFDLAAGSMGYVYSMYLHLSKDSVPPGVEVGSSVFAGQLIGKVDNTGSGSFGSHLHFQVVVHPLSGRTLEPFTLDSENRSRNPEMWLAPYTGSTARAVGKVTDANGSPISNLVICGLQKPYGGYTWSRTYSYPWANPDDYFVENFSTTDVQPGTYHLYAYPYQGPGANPCQNPPAPVQDLGVHSFVAGQATYVGLFPVFLPHIRSGAVAGNSILVVRNNGGKTARVDTTFFSGATGSVLQRRTDMVSPNKSIQIDPTGSFANASALVVGSQDISVIVRQQLPGSVYASYLGVTDPTPEVFVPLLHRNNSNWFSQLNIQNTGFSETTVTIEFKPWNGVGRYCTLSYQVQPYLARQVDLSYVGNNCITNGKEPVFVGSAYIKSEDGQPLAVTYPQQLKSGSTILALMESSKSGGVANSTYAPLIQNYNSYYQIVSGVVAQNASPSTSTIMRRFRQASGMICATWNSSVLGYHSSIDVLPPGPSSACPAVLSAQFRNLSGGDVSATVNQFWSGYSPYPRYWTDYPAAPNPANEVIIPWWFDQNGWDSAMVVRNTSNSTATGSVQFYNENGTSAGSPVPFSISGYGFAIIDAPVNGLSGSAKVAASQGVAVMVNHYNASPGGDKIMSNIGDHKGYN